MQFTQPLMIIDVAPFQLLFKHNGHQRMLPYGTFNLLPESPEHTFYLKSYKGNTMITIPFSITLLEYNHVCNNFWKTQEHSLKTNQTTK